MSTWDGGTCRFTPRCLMHDGSVREHAPRRRALTDEQVTRIRDSNEPATVLMRRYGVSIATIYRARHGYTYRSVR